MTTSANLDIRGNFITHPGAHLLWKITVESSRNFREGSNRHQCLLAAMVGACCTCAADRLRWNKKHTTPQGDFRQWELTGVGMRE